MTKRINNTKTDRKTIQEQIKQGKKIRTLAREMGVARNTVKNALKTDEKKLNEQEIKKAELVKWQEEWNIQVQDRSTFINRMIKAGYTHQQIADVIGTTRSTISTYVTIKKTPKKRSRAGE